uniref:Hypothetical Ccr_orf64-like protein n=1 Tax=Boldia erythrosiphon TaxID=74908 RepID=A0A1Y9TLQ4_9RHOD|nr:hypothetical Ccr_orf64-like protein [Boldia erythrosiphon]ARO90530.1 hypothetical Ccr_orf64-like protein [Boldia erythrosiphon]
MTEREIIIGHKSGEIYDIEETRPRGWSVTCLDETIFYYLDCNYVNMCNISRNKLDKE